MDDQERQDRLSELNEELEAINGRLWEGVYVQWHLALPLPQIRRKPLRLSLNAISIRRRLGSLIIAYVYGLFVVSLGVIGALLILFGENRTPELGIALVVGSLFSLGAILAAIWVLTVEGERERYQRVFGPDVEREIDDLRSRRDTLMHEIRSLRSSTDDKERQPPLDAGAMD